MTIICVNMYKTFHMMLVYIGNYLSLSHFKLNYRSCRTVVKGKIVPLHTMKAYRGVQAQSHVYLISGAIWRQEASFNPWEKFPGTQ
jgi:hypothetical protein